MDTMFDDWRSFPDQLHAQVLVIPCGGYIVNPLEKSELFLQWNLLFNSFQPEVRLNQQLSWRTVGAMRLERAEESC